MVKPEETWEDGGVAVAETPKAEAKKQKVKRVHRPILDIIQGFLNELDGHPDAKLFLCREGHARQAERFNDSDPNKQTSVEMRFIYRRP